MRAALFPNDGRSDGRSLARLRELADAVGPDNQVRPARALGRALLMPVESVLPTTAHGRAGGGS